MDQYGVPNINEWRILKAATRKFQTIEQFHQLTNVDENVLRTVCRTMRMNGWLDHKYQSVPGQSQDLILHRITPLGTKVRVAIKMDELIALKAKIPK